MLSFAPLFPFAALVTASRRQFSSMTRITESKFVTAEEAVSIIKSNDRVFFHSAAAFPSHLSQATASLVGKVTGVEVCSLHVEGEAFHLSPKAVGTFLPTCFFLGKQERAGLKEGLVDFVPIFLSDIPRLFKTRLPLDVAFISVSPPDKRGFCSLGPSVDISLSAVHSAKKVVAQVNKFIPRVHGEGIIHVSRIDYLVERDQPIPEAPKAQMTPSMMAIGQNVASLIEDGATLQMGIGAIPDATLSFLGGHQQLGVHTEMFSDGLLDLYLKGIVTNNKKIVRPGHIVSSFIVGSKRLYDFIDDNPLVHLYPSEFVNDPAVIKQNPKVIAINSAIEIDITGQVCADSLGRTFYSGVGGQVDFERGAALSEGGKPIIALSSRTSSGQAKIVMDLKPGAGVTTTRAHAHWIVTEHGKTDLWGMNVAQRAHAMISLAHPDDRSALSDAAAKRFGPAFLRHTA